MLYFKKNGHNVRTKGDKEVRTLILKYLGTSNKKIGDVEKKEKDVDIEKVQLGYNMEEFEDGELKYYKTDEVDGNILKKKERECREKINEKYPQQKQLDILITSPQSEIAEMKKYIKDCLDELETNGINADFSDID